MKKEFRDFKEARAFARKLGFVKRKQWYIYSKSDNKPKDIPSNPSSYYKGKGWNDWNDWLNSGNIAPTKKQFISFEQARIFVRELKFSSVRDWKIYCAFNQRPPHIPSDPSRYYKDKGWKGWGDFLGTNKNGVGGKKHTFRTFEQGKEFVKGLQFTSIKQWWDYCASGNKPKDIPSNPGYYYKGKGWKGLPDWLGYK